MSKPIERRITETGFVFGAAEVRRISECNGHVFIEVRTPKQRVELRITPSGLIKPHDGRSGMTPTHIFPMRVKPRKD